jgi:hypothetical protein
MDIKKLIIILYLFPVFIFTSCLNKSNKRENKFEQIHIQSLYPNENVYVADLDNSEKTKIIYLSDIFKNVQVIILENQDNALIGHVSKLIAHKDYIFVLDRSIAKALFVFGRTDGKFIRKIGNIGQGPDEYIEISDFTVDKEHDIIYIMDPQTQKISWFDINSGEYIQSVRIINNMIRSFQIQYLNGKMYADAYYPPQLKNESFLLRTINLSTGEQEECWMSAGQYNKDWSELYFTKNMFISNEDLTSVKFNHLFMDTVVNITPEKITPYIVIKSKDILKQSDLQKLSDRSTSEIISSLLSVNKIYGIYEYQEFGKYIYFYCQRKNERCVVLQNKESKETLVADVCIDDLVFKKTAIAIILPQFYYAEKKGVYGIIQPMQMGRFLKLYQDESLSDNVSQLSVVKNLTEASNPILFYYEYEE